MPIWTQNGIVAFFLRFIARFIELPFLVSLGLMLDFANTLVFRDFPLVQIWFSRVFQIPYLGIRQSLTLDPNYTLSLKDSEVFKYYIIIIGTWFVVFHLVAEVVRAVTKKPISSHSAVVFRFFRSILVGGWLLVALVGFLEDPSRDWNSFWAVTFLATIGIGFGYASLYLTFSYRLISNLLHLDSQPSDSVIANRAKD